MKRLFKYIFITTLFLLLLSGLIAIYSLANLSPILGKTIGGALKTKVEIKNVVFDRKNHTITVKDITVYNTPDFNDNDILAEVPSLTIYYDPKNLIKDKKLHLKKVSLYIKSLGVTKRQDGKMNVDALKISDTDMNFQPVIADELTLTLDNVLYKEFRKNSRSPHIEIFEVNIKDKQYQALENIDHIATKIVIDALEKTTIKGTTLYASATLLGISTGGAGILATSIISGDNNSRAEFKENFDYVYRACIHTISTLTDKFKENKNSGIITTRFDDTAVKIKVLNSPNGNTQVRVYASVFIIPKSRTAKAILYAISREISK